ncbi:S1 family peptidase [Gemmatimonas sp. UBA7669]|uniref:S1 family peptidase n=1 Tax=Gemmatimonas sp. UBA7669 TaxID=1946568 RepID=UPI0039C8A110
MIPDGWVWNQAELELNHVLNEGLVSLVAFDLDGFPRAVGSGFFVSAQIQSAVVCTAAHVLREVERLQQPRRAVHPTTPTEFRTPRQRIELAKEKLRVLCIRSSQVEMAPVSWCILDDPSDLAFLGVEPQGSEDRFKFDRELRFVSRRLSVGDQVAVLGYNAMSTAPASVAKGATKGFQLARELVLRLGSVTALHEDGHILCRDACFETSIPVSSGMSGSPVVLYANDGEPIEVVGVVCSGPEPEDAGTLDRRISGCSIVACLRPEITSMDGKQVSAQFLLKSAELVQRAEDESDDP